MTYIYTLYDKVAEEYGPIFEQKNDNVAIRCIEQQFGANKHMLASDFILYRVGGITRLDGQFAPEFYSKFDKIWERA